MLNTIIYWSLWSLFRGLAHVCFRYKLTGQSHIPREGGLLIAANHASFLDIPLLGCGIPRRVAFLGRRDLFPIPVLNSILQKLGWIPIRQDRLDRRGFQRARRLLEMGQTVVIFPEGSRTQTGRLGAGRPGLATLVAATGCRILPAYIAGTFEALPMGARWIRFHPVKVAFGQPIDFLQVRNQYGKKAFYTHVTHTVMCRIAELEELASDTELCDERI
ncbi:MAG: 1-acyl-sn-glycerol-3-phosphate acyltransferase [Nitrospiraceae bacterium]